LLVRANWHGARPERYGLTLNATTLSPKPYALNP